jgi:hypothetical protein
MRDLAACTRRLGAGIPADRDQAQTALPLWRSSPDPAGPRDPAAPARLPPPGREECRALWGEFDVLIRRAQAINRRSGGGCLGCQATGVVPFGPVPGTTNSPPQKRSTPAAPEVTRSGWALRGRPIPLRN